MTERDIEAVIGKYAAAARAAVDCGFRMILVHAGHGWFLHQFLSPSLNTRKDKWGGPAVENRARLTVEVCRAVRRAVGPNIPIEVRISGSECCDGGSASRRECLRKQLDGHADLSTFRSAPMKSRVVPVTHPSSSSATAVTPLRRRDQKARQNAGGHHRALVTEMMEDIVAPGRPT
jgi:2,4-dienoyl-CoA reductase-like NADH-dependent reductase (Old Yellow Enzyme family)